MSAQAISDDDFNVLQELKVEDYLKTVSYDLPGAGEYIPSEFALNFVNFIKMVNGEDGEEHKTPVVHYRMLDTLIGDNNHIANLCHRGAAKTTLMGEYLILYLAVYGELPNFGKVNFILYVSDSIENGVKSMRKNLEFRWDNSDFLQEYLPRKNADGIEVTKFTDVRWQFTNTDGKQLIVKGYGAKTGVRGTKEKGKRPELALLDDLISDEDARSDTIIGAVEDTVYKAVEYALHPSQKMTIWSGTPFNARDPLYKAVESGVWAVNVFPVCENFPCSREDFQGSWPDRFPYDYVKAQYENALKLGKVDTFNQELMLRIMSDDDRLILDTDIRWYNSASMYANKGKYNFYITTDFATSSKRSADYSVISVWAYNNIGDWMWVDGICKRQTMDKNMDDLFRLSQQWEPQSVGIEVSGQQGGFIPWITQEMLNRNTFFSLATENNKGEAGIRPTTDKLTRFNLMVPIIKAGKFYLPLDQKHKYPIIEALNEISLVSKGGMKSKHDDWLDTVSMLANLTPWKPSETAEFTQVSDSLWEADTDNNEFDDLDSYIV